LHMSQSPLSRAIRELERELGVVLFVRTTRSVELTAAGSVLLERSRRALAEIDGAVADVRRSAKAVGEVLGIGYGRSAALWRRASPRWSGRNCPTAGCGLKRTSLRTRCGESARMSLTAPW
jgi:DNA-binding transcriptional LysR family regulator